MNPQSIKVPSLLIDEVRCRANIRKMVDKARRHGLLFRPHCKTHQLHQVAGWMREEGVQQITVSSLRMAEYFAADGWDNITVAFPVNVLEIDRINALAAKIDLHILLDSSASIQALAKGLQHSISVFIEVDTGYGRSGVLPDRLDLIDALIQEILAAERMSFAGFLGHAGHSYAARGKAEILEVHEESLKLVKALRAHYLPLYPNLIMSMGDTPTCSVAEDFTGIDEIRPGNFVFYDLTQANIGSCTTAEIAVAMACPVVACYPERKEVIIYGGGVHFAKDRLGLADGQVIYGRMVRPSEQSWGAVISQASLSKISQEHGTLSLPAEECARIKVGEIVLILPVHACMCANLMAKTPIGEVKVL